MVRLFTLQQYVPLWIPVWYDPAMDLVTIEVDCLNTCKRTHFSPRFGTVGWDDYFGTAVEMAFDHAVVQPLWDQFKDEYTYSILLGKVPCP